MSDDRLHICHVLLTDRFAGSERYALELANWQAQRHRVSLILPRSAAENRDDALAHRVDAQVQIHLLGGWKLMRSYAACKVLQRLRPDVAHAHLSQACKAVAALPRGRTLRTATLHIHYKSQQHRELDALIAIAPWQLAAVPPQLPCEQIDNWSVAPLPTAGTRAALRAQLGLSDDVLLVGALGRTERSKGLDLLLQAWRQAALPNARLAIVGDGRDWAALRRQAPADVIMPGFVSNPQAWFAAFDLFVSAARSEPFGLVFLEAMHAGLPILASASQGAMHLKSLIQRPLLPCEDVPALCDALRAIAAQPPARQQYPLEGFQLPNQAAHIEAFYRRQHNALLRL
ncbi:glycosyltransferase [Roseateles sp. BYS180W]|uniref:Glycosyltransferase n=1 Tax=Roseateles rivi TaxID=3299028 RepID=A0ABW7FY03_9BURK